jgi:hypothetical protein
MLILVGSPSLALEELILYDNFKGKFIDPNKWEPDGSTNTPRESFDLVREVRRYSLRMLNRIYATIYEDRSTSVRVRFPVPHAVTAIKIKGKVKDLELIECAGNDRIRALRASGFFFNTGTITDPVEAEGDVLASIHAERRGDSLDPPGVLRVVATVFKCLDRYCDAVEDLAGPPMDLGEYLVGEKITLLMQWDEANNQFIFQRDNEPEFIYTYPADLNAGPANLPRKRLGISPRVAHCTVGPEDPQPVAFVETRIYKVFVNESAAPAP